MNHTFLWVLYECGVEEDEEMERRYEKWKKLGVDSPLLNTMDMQSNG